MLQICKTTLALAFILLIIQSCKAKKAKTKATDLTPLSVSAEIRGWQDVDRYKVLTVKTSLNNNTGDTIRYLTMYCSWDDAYTVDTKQLLILGEECDKNFPTDAFIPPYGHEDRLLMLMPNQSLPKISDLHFRVGFNWVHGDSLDFTFLSELSYRLRNKENIIWSDTLEIH